MRIAMLGPWESVVSLLTEELVSRGFDVTLFATGDSETKGKLHAVCAQGYEEDHSITFRNSLSMLKSLTLSIIILIFYP